MATTLIILAMLSAPILGPRVIQELNRRDTEEVRTLEQDTAWTLAELAEVEAQLGDSGRVSRWHDEIALSLLVVRLLVLVAGVFIGILIPVLAFLMLYETEQRRYRVLNARWQRARARRDEARRRIAELERESGMSGAPSAGSARRTDRRQRKCG